MLVINNGQNIYVWKKNIIDQLIKLFLYLEFKKQCEIFYK